MRDVSGPEAKDHRLTNTYVPERHPLLPRFRFGSETGVRPLIQSHWERSRYLSGGAMSASLPTGFSGPYLSALIYRRHPSDGCIRQPSNRVNQNRQSFRMDASASAFTAKFGGWRTVQPAVCIAGESLHMLASAER